MKQKSCKRILTCLCIALGICLSFAGCMSEHPVKSTDTNAAAAVDEDKSSDSGDTTVTVSSKEEQNTKPETETESEKPADGDKEAPHIISNENGTSGAAKGITADGNTAPVSRGDVKSGTAFEIDNYQKLVEFASRVNDDETDLNAVLTADIEADEYKEWIPIGRDADHKYVGVFDGRGYKITYLSNANVNSKPTCAGLFGYIGAEGVVRNITIENADIRSASTASPGIYAGAAAGYSEGTLINIIVKGNENIGITVHTNAENESGDFTGGLVGYNKGTVTDSCVIGKCTISSVSYSSSVKNTCVGGIAGYNGGSICNCYGDLSDIIKAEARNDAYVGGIAGYNDTGAAVLNCENRGSADITASLRAAEKTAAAGGITGYNNGNIEKTFCSGSGDIQAIYDPVRRNSNYYAGALAGWNGPDAVISYCCNCGNAAVKANGGNQPTCAGGMVGYNQGTIEKSYRSGSGYISAKGSGDSYAGALAGCNDGSSAKILNCYNCGNGEIKAVTAAGGLAGCNSGTVQYAYHCGRNDISAATIGGVIGKNEGTATNCYYDRNVCAIEGATELNNWKAVGDGDGGGTNVTGLTTDSMNGENAADPGNMNFEAGEESPWYPGLEYESGGLRCDCYPHLRGFVYDTTKDIADWPPRGEYKIDSYEKLKQFAGIVNAGSANVNAILTADIACNDNKWIPIGDAQIKYVGTFDGCGHTITGLNCTIDESQSVYAGLFGYIGQGGTVKNIGIVSPKINSNAASSNDDSAQNTDVFAGAIAGVNDGKIQQCYLSGGGTVRGFGISPCVKNMNVNVGALAGKNAGTIQDCGNYGSTDIKAGFKFTDDYNKTYRVDSKNEVNAGGIAGYNSGTIKNCYNRSTGKITATQSKRVVSIKESNKKVYYREVLQSYTGAIAGSVSDDSIVENCSYDFWSDAAALCALTLSSNKPVSYSDDAGVNVTDGKAKIDGIKAGTVLILMYSKDTSISDGSFIGWYSNEKLVTDSSVYEFIISENVEFEIKLRDENEKIIKFAADLNGEKQTWEIVTITANDDISSLSFPEMNFYGFKLDGWKAYDDVNIDSGALYTAEEARNKVANKFGESATTVTVVGVFSRTTEAVNSGIPGVDGKYTVTVCCNNVVVERLFRDFAASEYFTFNADEIERYVDTNEKTFSHWLLDDMKISSNREVTFRVAKDCVLNAVYVSDRSPSVKLTKVNIDNVDNTKAELEAEVNCENSDLIDSVKFRYQAADVITGKKDETSYTYTATILDIDVNKTYLIQPVVIFNNGLEPMECEEETVTVDGGMIVSPASCFQYDEASLITEMNVSADEGNMIITAAINSESVAKVLKVRFIYRESMETEEIAAKDDVTGKYTAAISGIDVDKVYFIQPVATINGVPVEGTRVEVRPRYGYDGSEKAFVGIVDMKTNGHDVIFTEHIYVPNGCIISKVGVLISVEYDKVSDASVLDTVTDKVAGIYNATIQALSGKIVDERGLTCTYTWTKKNIDPNKKVYVLAYLVYIDEFHEQHIVCGIVNSMIA